MEFSTLVVRVFDYLHLMQVGSLPPYKRDGRGLILGSQWILVFLVGFSSAMFDFFSSSTLLWLGLGILEEEELSMLVVHLSDFEAQPRHSGKRVYHSKTFISPSRSPLLLRWSSWSPTSPSLLWVETSGRGLKSLHIGKLKGG